MKKIVIFGSYNGSSIGDTALLLGLIQSIKRVEPTASIQVLTKKHLNLHKELSSFGSHLTNNVSETVVFYNKSDYKGKYQSLKYFFLKGKNIIYNKPQIREDVIKLALKDADHLIIGGGNLIMDLFEAWPDLLYAVIKICIANKIGYSFIGVGAGPINTLKGRSILYKCLYNADKVFFRDEQSMHYCNEKLGYNRGKVAPDCVLGIEWTNQKLESHALSINLAPIFGENWPYKSRKKFNIYINNYKLIIEDLVNNHDFDKINIFSTNTPLDEEAVLAFIDVCNSVEFECNKNQPTVYQVLELLSHSKLTVATRLHAALLAYIADSKVIAIAYQPKVIDVLNTVGVAESVIDIDNFIKTSNPIINYPKSNPKNKHILRLQLDAAVKSLL